MARHFSPSHPPQAERRFGIRLEFGALLALAVLPWLILAAPLFAADGSEFLGRPAADTTSAQFAPCGRAKRITCIVDGDTLWLNGEKIRIADIDTPEISPPACKREAALGQRATERLIGLANAGPFTVARDPGERDGDYFGRSLRILTRDGQSLGQILVREKLAATWGGPSVDWCAAA